MSRVARKAAADGAMDEENEENIPPQSRRSERVKGRKSASKKDLEDVDLASDDEEAEEVEEEPEEVVEDDSDDDEEEEQPRKRAKKTPPAKLRRRSSNPKTNGVSRKGRKSRTPKKNGTSEVVESTTECPMLEALLDDKIALDPTVMEWIERYEEDETVAMTEMVNFILRCCGCSFELRQEDVNDEDNIIDNLAEIQEAYKQETNPREYPLIANKKTKFAKFPKRLNEFFRRLLQNLAGKGMLYQQPSALDKIQQWVFSLSSTNFRPFRHTATVISLGFITTLCDVYSKTKKANDNSTVLLEKEKKSRKTAKVKDLQRILNEQQTQIRMLTELMESTYDSVFVHRFRDVDHRIRTECVHELGLWMQRLPEVYFDAAHLRYMGWALSDSNATTRLDVVKSLQKLYESEEYISNLRHFTERFQSRFVEMATSDADRSVRVATIGLLDNIRKRDLLEPEDIDKISLMIFDPESRIRRAVASIFLSNVDAMYEEMCENIGGSIEDVENELGDDKDGADGIPSTWLKYNALVKALAKYDQMVDEVQEEDKADEAKLPYKGLELGEVESRISQAASAILMEMDELNDWDSLATYLLRDHSPRPDERGRNANNILSKARRACALKAPEEIMLLEVLNKVLRVRRDIEDEQEQVKGKKRKRGASEAPEAEDEIDVSTGLVRKLPQLIRRFGSKPETATQILRMVQCVKLDKYNELREVEALETLLEDVGKQFMNHTDAEVFKEVSASLLHAQTFEHIGHITEPKVIELQDEVNTDFLSTVNGKDLITSAFTSEEVSDLTTAVARLENLLSVTDCTVAVGDESTKQGRSSFTLLTNILERAAISHDSEEIELVCHALKAVRWYFMWRTKSIAATADDIGIDETALDNLREQRSTVIDDLKHIIRDRPADEVKVQATTLLVDLHTLFTTIDESTRDSLLTIDDYQLSSDLQNLITDVLEEEIHLLHLSEKKKSNIEHGENEEDEDEEMPDADLSPEARSALHEKRVCDLAARMTLAVLGGALPKSFAQNLQQHKGKVGQSYDKVILELGVVPEKPAPAKKPEIVQEPVMEDMVEVAPEMGDS